MIDSTGRRSRAPYGRAMDVFQMLISLEGDHCTEWPYGIEANGYGMLNVNGESHKTHVLACIAAHGERPEGLEVAHSCGNRRCINPRHLRWATPVENQADRLLHGTDNNGHRNGRAKLSESDIPIIRARLAAGHRSCDIARDYGVSRTPINLIRREVTWRHVA